MFYLIPTAKTLLQFDTCECGDYRFEHRGGSGPCSYRDHHIPDPELNTCRGFRFFRAATEVNQVYTRPFWAAVMKQETPHAK